MSSVQKSQPAKSPDADLGQIYEMKITLMEISPRVWRRFSVPGSMALSDLHEVLQIVMGWENCHLHSFKIEGREYGDGGGSCLKDPTIAEVIPPFRKPRGRQVASRRIGKIKSVFHYEYDFGDFWQHEIRVEKVGRPNPKKIYPCCLDGERSAPPEDCGGLLGYREFLDEVSSRQVWGSEDGEEDGWISKFKSERFDLDGINARLLLPQDERWTICLGPPEEEPTIPSTEECHTFADRARRVSAIIKVALVDRDLESLHSAQLAFMKLMVEDVLTPVGAIEPVEKDCALAVLSEMRSNEAIPAWKELQGLVDQLQKRIKRLLDGPRRRRSRKR